MMNRKGFSLVEISIAYAVLSVVILGALQLVDVQWKQFQAGELSSSLRMQIITAFSRVEKELKSTQPAQLSLAAGATATTLTFRVPQDGNNDGTVLDANGSLEWSGQITYALSNSGQLTRTTGGVTTVLANSVTGLTFTRPAAPTDVIRVTVTSGRTTVLGRTLTDTDQISVQMRN